MPKFQKLAPLAFTILGALGIAIPVINSFLSTDSLPSRIAIITFVITYLGWMGYESKVTRGELARETTHFDRFSMEFAAVVKIGMLFAMFAPGVDVSVSRGLVGFVLAWGGIGLRGWSIHVLGSLYSHRIRVPEQVRDTGPYALIRHPAYAGTAIAHAGFVMVFMNRYSLCGLACWFFAVWLRTHLEEKALAPDATYQSYARRVRYKLFPLLW